MTERNFCATVEYDGTAYSGFQIQRNHRTIQGELERALLRVTRESLRVACAGRTDSGVHARGQVISFRSCWRHDCAELRRAVNAVISKDIALREVTTVDAEFHARYSARQRTYIYSVYLGEVRSPLLERYAHRISSAGDVEAMNRAAEALVGEHDFAAFGQPPSGTNTVRAVYRAEWRSQPTEWLSGLGNVIQFEIAGKAFLRTMVRRVVGALLAVGKGTIAAAEFGEILSSMDIHRALPPAPACGLCLWKVDY